MNVVILLIILVTLLCLTIGPSFGVPIGRAFWVVLFILLIVAIVLVLLPMIGHAGPVH
jgi:hypothetical protein